MNAALAYLTPQHEPRAYLPAELPAIANGRWQIFPDGRMQTTYHLRPSATWHDGTPVTASDFVFGHRVRMDPEMPATKAEVDRRMSRAVALDERTLLIEWTSPYLWGGMVSGADFPALPRHALEELFQTDREAFIHGPPLARALSWQRPLPARTLGPWPGARAHRARGICPRSSTDRPDPNSFHRRSKCHCGEPAGRLGRCGISFQHRIPAEPGARTGRVGGHDGVLAGQSAFPRVPDARLGKPAEGRVRPASPARPATRYGSPGAR